jgi:hypothetical protein
MKEQNDARLIAEARAAADAKASLTSREKEIDLCFDSDEEIIFAKNGKASVIDARPSKESSILNAS